MNLQPRRRRVPSPNLLAATGLSLALHGLLIWPLPLPRSIPERPVAQVGALRLVPTLPAAASVAVAGNLPAAPQASLSIDRPSPLLTAAGRAAPPGPDGGALSPVVAESSLRAFRYAIARSVARDGAPLQARGVRMVIALRLHARRVVAVSLVRSSGHDALDARVLAAFRAAASTAVRSVDLPPHGFAVELELDGESDDAGQDDAGQDERPRASG
ncbi:hypothetical protein BSY238_2674 [Methyloversatilis sp. RAC08]|uniref:hypothetical protein n=1 Tax=Methyloversatilis sp. RAC08 TaxID=1842540 RepID=UPI00083D8880|nr:hypothetical protein [Methyloversatilis sp. RAC08]AOF80730.1 hypothetical protein BSY238_2674 [Methyloversatilis sp. RAC08]